MDNFELLPLVRADLEQPAHAVDDFLVHLIGVAIEKIGEYGIQLDDENMGDTGIIVMYAAWLYRKRKASTPEESAMPRMLQFAMHNRLMAQKGKVSGS